MDALSPRITLHDVKPTFLWWVVPLFVATGCVLVAANVWLPLLAREAAPAGPARWLAIGVAVAAGLAIPVGAGLMVVLIPRMTTVLDPQRRMLVMELRRPLGISVKEYPVAEIADVKAVRVGNRRYALTMILRSGENVRLDYRLLPSAARVVAVAAGMREKLRGMGWEAVAA